MVPQAARISLSRSPAGLVISQKACYKYSGVLFEPEGEPLRYSVYEVLVRTGIKSAALRYWIELRLITPYWTKDGQPRFSAEEVDVVLEIRVLQLRGCDLETVRAELEEFRHVRKHRPVHTHPLSPKRPVQLYN